MLGLFTVVATATGCLYFLDQDNVAASKGLNAAGVLLLILNVFYVMLMTILISKTSAPRVKEWVAWFNHRCSQCLGIMEDMQCWSYITRKKKLRSASSSDGSFGASLSRRSSVELNLLSRVFARSGTLRSTTAESI